MYRDVKQAVFAGACFFCMKKTNNAWCIECEQEFILPIARCPVCARHTANNAVCATCIKRRPYFTQTEVVFNYQYPANQLIKTFKYNKRPELARCFAEKLVETLKNKTRLPEILLPVPLHKKRQAERGYNQSLELAAQIASRLGMKVNSSLCRRIKNTDPQSTLPMKTRKNNVKDAFCLNDTQIPEHIAIVDDVITTGSTVNEISALLIKAGCRRVDVWAIART